jgi:hypothetical protein
MHPWFLQRRRPAAHCVHAQRQPLETAVFQIKGHPTHFKNAL